MTMTAAKAVVAAIGTIVVALTAALADEVLDISEIVEVGLLVVEVAATTWATWRIPNREVT